MTLCGLDTKLNIFMYVTVDVQKADTVGIHNGMLAITHPFDA